MLDAEAREDLIERITAIFTNEANATEFNENPDAYVDEHLPEGTEAADISSCLPDVGERTGLDFSNVASTGGSSPAGELSHTYQTIYQQNTSIYAEEGSQVTNIQGDGNAVSQQDVDVDIDYGEGETDDTETDPTEPTDTTETPDPEDPMAPEGEDTPEPDGGMEPEPEIPDLPEPEPEPEPPPEPEPEPEPAPEPEPEPEPPPEIITE
jgi:hypothetical protein